MTKSKASRGDTAELESLMREFPEWKHEFPEASHKVYPERLVLMFPSTFVSMSCFCHLIKQVYTKIISMKNNTYELFFFLWGLFLLA